MKHILNCLLIFIVSCKKDTDTVTTQTIHGQVYNLCTDSGLANVTVFFNINNSAGGGGSTLQTMSGTNGMFSFINVQIHSNSDYTYGLEVQDNPLGAGSKPAIDGADVEISKSNLNQIYVISVAPHFNSLKLYYPNGISPTVNDTFTLIMQQKIMGINVPSSNYKLTIGNSPTYPPPSTNYIGDLDNYWMGKWYTTLNKTKKGVHTIKTDSFYVGWGATIIDTIPW